jgi:hypothetical protein
LKLLNRNNLFSFLQTGVFVYQRNGIERKFKLKAFGVQASLKGFRVELKTGTQNLFAALFVVNLLKTP